MQKNFLKKELVVGIVLLFLGAGVLLVNPIVKAGTTVYANNRPGWESAVVSYEEEFFTDATLNPGVSVVTDLGYVDTINKVWWDRLIIPSDPSGPTKTTWQFALPLVGFGGYWNPGIPGGPGASIAVEIDGSWKTVGEIPSSYTGQFWGFVSTKPFSNVRLTSGSTSGWCETYELDNMVYSTIPPVAVDKKVWNGTAWVDDIRVPNGTTLNFRIQIKNNKYLPTTRLTITDYLSIPQLKYDSGTANPAPIYASDNEVRWSIATLNTGQTINITYNATAIHVCYGWNSVYVKNYKGKVIDYDLTKVKVVNDAGQPALAVKTLVWDNHANQWSDYIGHTLNAVLTFKTTVTSTALSTLHEVTVTDSLPALLRYNYDATLTPASASDNEIIWSLGELAPGDEQEITYTVTTKEMGMDYAMAYVTSTEGYIDEDYVLVDIDSAPDMVLLYPAGGETLKDSIIIQWTAYDVKDKDNLPISLYYKTPGDTLWTAFPNNPYANSGEFSWDTTSVPDGIYQLQIATKDSNKNVVNVISDQFQIRNTEITENLAPVTPDAPSGSAEGKPGTEYTYSASTTDPENDHVYYLWDWGDGTQSGWLGPYNSGDTIETTHTWEAKGQYSIKVKAKDVYDHESDWSDPLPITMPYTYKPLQQFLQLLFERFPQIFPVLRQLLGY